jgi:threonine synthase
MTDANMPEVQGSLAYSCIGCGVEYDIYDFVYTCPECGSLLKIKNRNFDEYRKISPQRWKEIFDSRKEHHAARALGDLPLP